MSGRALSASELDELDAMSQPADLGSASGGPYPTEWGY